MFNRFLNKSPGSAGRSLIAISGLLLALISNPARSETTVYAWQDESGTIAYSDNPVNAPSDAEIKILSQTAGRQMVSATGSTQVVVPPPSEPLPRTVTQGEFAVRLVEELGLAEEPTEEEASDLLASARISPKLGQWELDLPMDPELTVRLRKLTVAAAERGWVTLSPEQSLLAFDTASALLGLTIPVISDLEETPDSPYRVVAETPPLVYVETPPPTIYEYYIWTPVAGGFWWNGFVLPGFFVLDVNIFFSSHHRFPFRDHRAFDPDHIGRRFRGHIVDHRIREFHRSPDRERVAQPGQRGRGPVSDRKVSLPKGKDPDFRRPGSDPSEARPEKRHVSPPPKATDPVVRHRRLSPRSDRAKPGVKSDPSRFADSAPKVKRSPSRPNESMPKVRPSPSRPVAPRPEVRQSPSRSIGPRPELARPSGGPPSARPRDSRPAVGSAPPRNPPDRNISAAAVAPGPARIPQGGFENVAGRVPSGR